jgi:hypothetical protein
MKTMTARRFLLEHEWKKLNRKAIISIDDLFNFMDQVNKLMQNYDDAVKSRDVWKDKFQNLKEKEIKKWKNN